MPRLSWQALLAAIVAVMLGCGASDADSPPPVHGGSAGAGGAMLETGGAGASGGGCVSLVVAAERTKRPADVIFVIDNSGSMAEEVDGVEQNINVSFAGIFEALALDYRVIMVTDHGAGDHFNKQVCVTPPLSNTTDCSGPPKNVPGRFYHYDIHVESWDAATRMFGSLFGFEPDEWSLAPRGWNEWLRIEALKVFVLITDDRMSSGFAGVPMIDENEVAGGEAAALAFDEMLQDLSPAQFGSSPATRNYVFYSIVGLPSKPSPQEPYLPSEPVLTSTCATADAPGTGYQALSNLTGGLRFPVCVTDSYDAVFEHIADSILDITAIPCRLDIPGAPPGQVLDLDGLELTFTSGQGMSEEWEQVSGPAACTPTGYYIDEPSMQIELCPGPCARLEGDIDATVTLDIPCITIAD